MPALAACTIRPAREGDRPALAAAFAALWEHLSPEEIETELTETLAGRMGGPYPLEILVAESADNGFLGFVEVGLRSHADGCDPRRPVGYLEGWYVAPAARRSGAGAALVAAAEQWARVLGCAEMASDTWIDNRQSQRAHEALGYEVVDRCVNYRKPLD